MAKIFTCDNCGGTFETTANWSDQKAQAEYEGNFPHEAETNAPRKQVCDPCFRTIMKALGDPWPSMEQVRRTDGLKPLQKD